jgi:hypothetical protein
VLSIVHNDAAVQVLYAALLVACLALIVGYHTRVAAVVLWLGVMSFQRRNPFVVNSGDGLIRLLAFYLMLAPAGAALSLDRWRSARERFWEFPARSRWPLRLMQIQLTILYLAGLWVKVQGTTWDNGTAVSIAMRIGDVVRFSPPGFVTHSLVISNLMTFGTLLIEFCIPIFVWFPRLRPWVLLAGFFLHFGIDLTIRVGFFSYAIFTLYLAFLSPAWAEATILRLRERWLERRQTGAVAATQSREPVPAAFAAGSERPDPPDRLPLPEH